jgi:hypothetical protein
MEKIKELTGAALYQDQLGGTEVARGSYKQGTYMVTYTGKEFYPLDPDPADIDIKDIAQALSNCCRFTGHVKNFYSVAQHSVIVSHLCEPENALAGLLHDASEAYLSDIARPVKYTKQMEGYRKIEHKLEEVIFAKFNLDFPMTKDVKRADDLALMTEGYYLFNPIPGWVTLRLADAGLTIPSYKLSTCWLPAIAKAMFMKRFILLTAGINTEVDQEEIDAATKEN